MKGFKHFAKRIKLYFRENLAHYQQLLWETSFFALLVFSLGGVILILTELGFERGVLSIEMYDSAFHYLLDAFLLLYLIALFLFAMPGPRRPSKLSLTIKLVIVVFLAFQFLSLLPGRNIRIFHTEYTLEMLIKFSLILIVFLRNWSSLLQGIYKRHIQSEKLFVFSFLFLIVIGAFLLMLPASNTGEISVIDAFFTSVSAVCVTGLTVVDTASAFTWFGKFIILALIQLGGIGIMTFASFFASMGKSGMTLKERDALGHVVVSKNMKKLFTALFGVVFLTIFIEIIGAFTIYFQLDEAAFSDNFSRFSFALFHAVSAFCNAGFSTATGGMTNEIFQSAWSIQFTIAMLFIFGGLGFFIISNYSQRITIEIRNLMAKVKKEKKREIIANILNINSRIVLRTTVILLLVGTFSFFILEYNGVLADMSFFEKLMTSFFSASTPRTAGFNTIDFAGLGNSTLLLIMLLMWIGASPGSTGGGIKTTTLALVFLNAVSLGRGKNYIMFKNRQISRISISRAFLIVTFSLIAIFIGSILLAAFEPQVELKALLFEAFSAFGTVGLSLNLTPIHQK